MEGPVRILPAYSRLLRALRDRLPSTMQLSFAAQVHWCEDPAFPSLAESDYNRQGAADERAAQGKV